MASESRKRVATDLDDPSTFGTIFGGTIATDAVGIRGHMEHVTIKLGGASAKKLKSVELIEAKNLKATADLIQVESGTIELGDDLRIQFSVDSLFINGEEYTKTTWRGREVYVPEEMYRAHQSKPSTPKIKEDE